MKFRYFKYHKLNFFRFLYSSAFKSNSKIKSWPKQQLLRPLTSVVAHGERASSRRLPDVLLVVVVLGHDRHLVGHQVGGVEAHAELTDHRDVGASLQRLHEGLGARLGDGAKVVDQVGLGHADAAEGKMFGQKGAREERFKFLNKWSLMTIFSMRFPLRTVEE